MHIIAVTHRALLAAEGEERLRSDAYYRMRVPSLRERAGDVLPLEALLLQTFARKVGKAEKRVSVGTMSRLVRYPSPGNVRELENGSSARSCTRPSRSSRCRATSPPTPAASPQEMERRHSEAVLAQATRVIEGELGAAKILELSPSTLRSRMERPGIERSA